MPTYLNCCRVTRDSRRLAAGGVALLVDQTLDESTTRGLDASCISSVCSTSAAGDQTLDESCSRGPDVDAYPHFPQASTLKAHLDGKV